MRLHAYLHPEHAIELAIGAVPGCPVCLAVHAMMLCSLASSLPPTLLVVEHAGAREIRRVESPRRGVVRCELVDEATARREAMGGGVL